MLGGFNPLPARLRSNGSLSDVSASQHARLCADMVAASRVSPAFKLVVSAASGLVYVRGMFGEDLVSVGGDSTTRIVTLPVGSIDAYGSRGGFRIENVHATAGIVTASAHTPVITIGSGNNTFTVEMVDSAGLSLTNWICYLKVW